MTPVRYARTGRDALGRLVAGTPVVAPNADGRLEVFAPFTGGSIRHIRQVTAGSTAWSDWQSLGSP
ncbi:hypothetical protein ABT263_02260 [Kitasatospora sp. NPDC001603]|uniref:hypothetical protein n=1 Tax=Kitasatospora sp. NPDC001603 TaxID=3154388 RepID=UPI00332CDD62